MSDAEDNKANDGSEPITIRVRDQVSASKEGKRGMALLVAHVKTQCSARVLTKVPLERRICNMFECKLLHNSPSYYVFCKKKRGDAASHGLSSLMQ